MSTETFTFMLKPKKELMKLTKKEIIEGLEGDTYNVNTIFKEKDEKIKKLEEVKQTAFEENQDLAELFREEGKKVEALNKDLSIMQQALNDVEEKNRALNVQLTDLRKALKTASQYL